MDWFDFHSTGVQALAAVSNVAVAAILVALTARYVKLTREIARSATDQIAYMRELANASTKQQSAALAALAQRIRTPIGTLRPDSPDHETLYHFSQLDDDDVRALETLARGVDNQAITLASMAATPLHTIIAFIRQARSIALNYGWSPNETEMAKWYEAHQSALVRLDELIAHCRARAI